jgi:SSS family transporter
VNYLTPADWLVVVAYVVGIVGFGIWFGRDQRTTRDYFLGSRNIPWWGIGMSIIAAETSALTIIGVPGLAYGSNLGFVQLLVGYVVARVLLALVLVPHYLRGEIYSPYQLLETAFGPGARRCAGGLFLVSETLAAGVRVYVACIPIQLLLGLEVLPAIVLFVVLSLVYTYVGGIKAVVWTDAVQFLLFMGGGLFALVYIPTLVSGGWGGAWEAARVAGKLEWFNGRFSLTLPFNIWMGIFGATVQVLSSHGAEQLIVQRVLACKSVTDGRRALILSAVLIFPLFLVFLLAGVLLWVYYQQAPMALPMPETTAGMKKNDYVFPIFILTVTPPVLKGFLIVAILSAAMSSVSSALSSLASVSTMDLLKGLSARMRPDADYLRWSKWSTLFWAAMLVLVAYASREANFVLNAAFSLRGLTSGALLAGLVLALTTRGSSLPPIAGMSVSIAVMTVLHVHCGALVSWPWYTLIGCVVALGSAAAARQVQAIRKSVPAS